MSDKPVNTWNTDGMYSDWSEKCPLHGAERYLWERYRKYGDRKFGASSLQSWYENGWEMLYSLQRTLFSCSSCSGRIDNAPFIGKGCEWPGCDQPADCLRNQRKTDRKDNYGDFIWEWLPDAPQFHCHAHHMEAHYGEKYIPPTLEEMNRLAALCNAVSRLNDERPPEEVKLNCGISISHTMMDGPYLKRLFELAQEEYEKIVGRKPQ